MTEDRRKAIVTGAASGIGLASARRLAQVGWDVAMVDLQRDLLHAEARRLTLDTAREALPAVADMASAQDVEGVARAVEDQWGTLHAVVNNAGVQRSGAVESFSEDDWDLVMGINPKTCFLAAKYTVPLLHRTRGTIINIASIAGLRGGPGQSAYSASKGAVVAFSRSLAVELAPQGIRVNCICPGWIDTPFNAPAIEFMGGRAKQDAMIAATVPIGRQGVPEEVASVAEFLAGEGATFVVGQSIVVDGGQV